MGTSSAQIVVTDVNAATNAVTSGWWQRLSANAAGSVIPALLQVAMVPVYLHYLGVGAFGLLALYPAALTFARVFDAGIGHSVNRALASQSTLPNHHDASAAVAASGVRKLLMRYWLIGLAIASTIVVSSVFASGWFRSSVDASVRLETTIRLIAVALFFAWPTNFYASALLGLNRTKTVNTVTVAAALLVAGGSLLLLSTRGTTVNDLLLWQALVAAAATFALHFFLAQQLGNVRGPHGAPTTGVAVAQPTVVLVRGTAGVTLVMVALAQIDRLLVTQLLPIAEYGAYMLGATVASAITIASAPVFASAFPHLTALFASHDENFEREYRRAFDTLLVIVVPAGIVGLTMSRDVLTLWTANNDVVDASHHITSILLLGAMALGVALAPISLQLAVGDARVASRLGIASMAVVVPAIVLAGSWRGAEGAALAWSIVVVLFALSCLIATHRRLLHASRARAIVIDFTLVIAAAASVGWVCAAVLAPASTRMSAFWHLAVAGSATLAIVFVVLTLRTRTRMQRHVR